MEFCLPNFMTYKYKADGNFRGPGSRLCPIHLSLLTLIMASERLTLLK